MEYQIIWLPKAEERFEQIITYLKNEWSQKEVNNFKELTKQAVNQIKLNPKQFKKSRKKSIYEVIITKHNLLLYHIKNDQQIELLTFFDTRQHPRKKHYL